WSHRFHHLHGRDAIENTIDGEALANGWLGIIRYYVNLFGWSYWYHEVLGYLYLLPARWHLVDRTFSPHRVGLFKYYVNQLLVLAISTLLIVKVGWTYILIKVAFGMYWGSTQNVAHYGLEIGGRHNSRLVSRTYRIGRILEFAFFGSGHCHLEHHAFPRVPGFALSSAAIAKKLRRRFGIEP